MKDFDAHKFENWCREVLTELVTFQAACVFGNRTLMLCDEIGKSRPDGFAHYSRNAAAVLGTDAVDLLAKRGAAANLWQPGE